jgi:hypothetical protein
MERQCVLKIHPGTAPQGPLHRDVGRNFFIDKLFLVIYFFIIHEILFAKNTNFFELIKAKT